MEWLVQIIAAFWQLSEEMAPYLLLGFGCAALLRCVVTDETVQRHLGQGGWRQTVKASLIGVPLPLCSCGIIPVAASLREQGGSPGAVTSFTASTPQTGVDSILATGALLSWPFAAIRVVVAFISGVLAGTLVDRFASSKPSSSSSSSQSKPCCSTPEPEPTCCSTPTPESEPLSSTTTQHSSFKEALHFGFVRLPSDIGGSLLLGLFLAGVLTVLLPNDLSGSPWTTGALAYLITTAAAIPLYVCSTGSIPMAYALLHAGFSPGAALIFLIAGPATNTATITALTKMLGSKAVALYLAAIILTAWVSAAIIDKFGGVIPINHGHEQMDMNTAWWKTASAVLLFALLLWGPIQSRIKTKLS
jgi:uncharacterized membrane protein YraQ (UPF0718 family)|tara:strand:- start:72088 stop:73170 length:1083 start_codon:yes stop_codon:yes gene_type:complete